MSATRDDGATPELRLAVVIVNYRTAPLVIDCLASLNAPGAMPERTRIVVVEADSQDGSDKMIGEAIDANGWSERTMLVALQINGGFGYGNNRGLEYIRAVQGEPEYVLFLNPDTVVRPSALHELLAFMDRTPGAGIAGSRLEDHDETRQACTFRFPTPPAELEGEARIGILTSMLKPWRVVQDVRDQTAAVDWVSGASMIVRMQLLRELGGFDERFFLYYEEVDLCMRARKAGWTCHHVPQSRVVHLVGRSTGVTARGVALPRRPDYWFRSRIHYYLKHHGRLYLLAADCSWIAGHLAFRVKTALMGQTSDAPPYILRDFLRHSFSGLLSPGKFA